MSFFLSKLSKFCFVLIASLTISVTSKAQTTLIKGDIAFTGYFSNGVASSLNDQFSFVLLTNITNNTVINFTDNGWLRTSPTAGSFRTGEGTVTYTNTIGGTINAGTEILITITGAATATATFVGGAPAGTATGATMPSLSTNGDQVIAYQGTTAAPTFISAIHKNVYSVTAVPPFLAGGDAVTTTTTDWDGSFSGVNASGLPALSGSNFLTNGVDAIWIPGSLVAEKDNARFNCTGPLGTAAQVTTAIYNVTNWQTNDDDPSVGPPSLTLPTGCSYITALPAPAFTLQPLPSTICAGSNTSFTVTATNALSYQWQVDNGGGFANITDDATYSGAITTTLTITAAPFSLNGYLYRCVATNATTSTNSNSAALTVTALPVNPTLLAKTPASATVADGTPVSATFNAGSGGTGCADDYRYTTDGGATYLAYTPGSNISTTGVAAGSGFVFIEGRRANCTSLCQSPYQVLASWTVTPLPAGPTTLNAGDIAFSGYFGFGASVTTDEFSFVLLKNIGPGTVINFTNNGWLSTNVFRVGEETVTWTSPAAALPAGTEIKIVGTTATRSGGGAAGSVAGTPLSLSANGDQILAYRGTVAAPTFISAIHMNVYSVANGDATTTSAAAWDGAANTTNASALPTGLTTGTNCIWIGTSSSIASEFDNARFGNCALPAVAGSVAALRTALNTQTNWIRSNGDPAGFTLPTGCNYLAALAPSINVTGTPLAAFSSCSGSPSAEQNFTVSGSALTADITITAPTDFEISITSGSGFNSSLTLTQSGGSVPNTIIYVRMAASATGTPSGNITVASSGVTTVNVAVSGTVNPIPPTPTITPGGPTTFCTGGSVTLTSSSATDNLWSTGATTQSISVSTAGTYTVTVTVAGCSSAPSAGTTVTVNPIPPTPTISAGGPTTFCIGGNVVLTSSSPIGNLWSTGETTQSITVTTAGAYTVTVTSLGCTSAPSSSTIVTVDALPTTAAAGPDFTACISPGTATMAANVPTVGTGSWSQAPGGPATAIIFTTGSATSNIAGLTTAGVYTFVWSITSGTCPPSRDTMNITVNANPVPFTLAGGGTFCPGTITLTGPVDPNYTYTWQRSLTGIANPNSFTSFGGITSTQDVTSSGNYRLIVTNQFGCATSDTTPVSMADYVFNGSLAAGDAQQTGRLNRFATLSTCAAPKACPLTFATTGARFYDSYNVTNPRNVPVCATIGLRSDCGTSLFNVAYLGSFNPTSLCTNYLADPGSSFPGTGYMEVTIPANATIVVVVHEVNSATGCAGYQLTVDVPRETGVTVNPNTPVCSGATVNLTAPIANTYLWNPGGATTQGITVTPAATTKYFVTTSYGNNGCTNLDSATVVVNQLPTTALAGNDTATCGLTINNLAANTPVVGTGTWTLVTGPGTVSFGNANAPNSSATASVNGVYTLRWTIATGAPCPNSSQDDVLVNFAATPSTADAGLDKTACISPGSVAMTALVPTAGTGIWTQVAGPVTANIISPTAPNTNITGLNTLGTYTFRWTVSNNPCPSNFDEVNVVVNGNPASFSITGGGTFCPSGTTLAGPVDPNYTYQWGKSYLTAPFSNLGTSQTQAVTSSGIYQLVVTNQFGCNTSTTTVVNVADYVFNGSLVSGDAIQTGRLNRFAAISTCAAPKACPLTFTTTGSRLYDSYTITNPRSVPVCAVIGLNSGCGTAIFSAAYSGSYDPNALCTNYLADPGSSPSTSIFYEATIPANGTIVVVVHEVNPGTGCANYTLTVDLPRDASPIIATPPTVTCASTTTLTAPVANSYSWNPGGATTRSIVTPPLFVDTKFYATMGYGNNGCNRLDSITVVVTSLPPTISCPANITQANTLGQCGRVVTYSTTVGGLPIPTETYAFTGATTASGSGNGSGSFFNVGVTTVTVTATNACGSVNCSFTVTINDTQAPTVTAGTLGSCYPTVAAAQAAALAATSATDNCPGVLTETASTVGTCSAVVTIRTTDVAGNFTDVTYNTRIDNTPPSLTCPAAVVVCGPGAVPVVDINTVTNVSDNCPGAIIVTHQGDVSTPSPTTPYVITRTYRATDGCGNFTECTQLITVNPIPNAVATPASQTVCSANTIATIVLTGAVSGTTYNWTRDNTVAATGIAASGSGNISGTLTNTTFAPVTVTFTITPTANGCAGPSITATVLVNPLPVMTALPAAQTICNGVTITPIVFASTTPGTTYTWTRDNSGATTAPGGIQASGSGPSITGFMINTTNAPITVTFTITPTFAGCVGTPVTATVTIQPTPTAVATPATQVSCSGAPIATINLTGLVAGTVYNWTRDNVVAATGIAASGTGNISGTLTTTGTTPVVVTFTITPSINGCNGPSIIATDTIYPTPSVNQPGNQVVCNGGATTAVAFTGTVAGTVFNWTNNTPSIGLAATGTGNIPVFTAVNTTNAPVTATITVTPVVTSTGCVGVARTFTITVNPTATVGIVPNQTLCTGSSTAAINFTSTVAGTTFSWTNNTPSIGLAASGTGNIPSFIAINTTPTAVTATITVTPNTAAGCIGVSTTFTITVNGNSVAPTGATSSVVANCGPTSATLTVVGGALGTGASWRWYSGSCGGTLVGTGASITIPVNTTTTYFVRAEGTCNTTGCGTSVTVTINTIPTISIAAAPFTALTPLLRTNLTATVNPTAVGNVVEWFKDNGPLPIATGLSITNINVDQLGSYRARVTTAQGCTATSNTIEIRDSATGQLFVYPNPNNGKFQIRYYLPENSISVVRKVVIFDSKGALVYNQRLSVQTRWGSMNINILGVAQGSYFIKILDVNDQPVVGARVQVLR